MPKVVSCARSAAHTIGKHFPCYSFPSVSVPSNGAQAGSGHKFLCGTWSSNALHRDHAVQTPKLKFDRVKVSTKMMEIVEQLKPLCDMVSTILDKELLGCAILKLDLLGFNHLRSQDTAINRPKTTPKIIEPELYGMGDLKMKIVDSIKHGIYCTNELTVVSLVGPGGIGKTMLTQHIYRELESSFQVSAWICVSLDFNADRLVQEIVKKIPKVNGEKDNAINEELIEQRLKSKRLLLVLDDVWTYHEDEWRKVLAPLRYNGVEKGHVVIVTTRIPKVASMVTTTNSSIDVERLGHEDIMAFFEVCVFGDQKPWEGYPQLCDVGSKIVKNLKGFPLAAKTVGRLLRNQLTLDHWTKVAESREWQLQTNDNDIMPALKLSYDYLPFRLQQCFSFCALFPEDYEFGSKELVHIWIGLGILQSGDQAERIEDVGLCYLNELVNYGFFKKHENENGPHYVIHDLLHDLAVKVSSYECLSICSSNVRSIQIPTSVCHLSINVDNTDVIDVASFEDYKMYLGALGKRLNVQNLRSLMLFGEYHGSFAKTFRDLLREARSLRVISLSGVSYSADDALLEFSELVHLRYLRIKSIYSKDMCLPSALFRFYHLEILDLEKWGGSFGPTTQMSNLVKLRHFLVPRDNLELHSSICEVGKLKFLEELRSFEVGKQSKGFELSQLGELTELGGSLCIYNLEKVRAKEEGKEVKLIHKNHLHKLMLEWDNNQRIKNPAHEDTILESLIPHKNLQRLAIRGHGGANCPSWLGGHLSVTNLESLSLIDLSWNKLPPLGDLWFIDDVGIEYPGCISSQSFQTLKRLELCKIARLRKWVGNGTCHLFSLLEVFSIEDCPELTELPFSHPACGDRNNRTWFPKLETVYIIDCPKLSLLPPIPWTPSCSIEIARAGSYFEKLDYTKFYRPGFSLEIEGKDGQHTVFWNGLAFHNLAYLNELVMQNCPPLPLIHIQKLKSLKTLRMRKMGDVLLLFERDSHNTGCSLPVELIEIERCGANGMELTQFLSHFPKLVELEIKHCDKITGLGVVEYEITTSSSADKMEYAHTGQHQQQIGREELVGGGLLLLPPQLERSWIRGCGELRLLPNSLDNDKTRGGGGLQRLCSLRVLTVQTCPKFLSSYSSSSASSCFPFPASLQNLTLFDMEGTETLVRLSNLISLTRLSMNDCGDLRGEGLCALVTQGRLTELDVIKAPNFFTGSESSWSHEEQGLFCSSKLPHLRTDDLEGVLTPPIFSLLFSSSLTKLCFDLNNEVERFTEEQEASLHLLTSLQILEFWDCKKLRHLPAGLTKLTSLKILDLRSCTAIQMLPKDGLPSCLLKLVIINCSAIKSLPKYGLPSCLHELTIINCEELKRQCRKLKGTVPKIIDY